MRGKLVLGAAALGIVLGAAALFLGLYLPAVAAADARTEAVRADLVEAEALVPAARQTGWCRGYIDGFIVNGREPPPDMTAAEVAAECDEKQWWNLKPEAQELLLGADPKADDPEEVAPATANG